MLDRAPIKSAVSYSYQLFIQLQLQLLSYSYSHSEWSDVNDVSIKVSFSIIIVATQH